MKQKGIFCMYDWLCYSHSEKDPNDYASAYHIIKKEVEKVRKCSFNSFIDWILQIDTHVSTMH